MGDRRWVRGNCEMISDLPSGGASSSPRLRVRLGGWVGGEVRELSHLAFYCERVYAYTCGGIANVVCVLVYW